MRTAKYKDGYTKDFLFRTRPEIFNDLSAIAEEKFMSVNNLINSILYAEIKKNKKKKENIR